MGIFRRKPKVTIILDDHAEWRQIFPQTEKIQRGNYDVLLHEALDRGGAIPKQTLQRIGLLEKFNENARKINQMLGGKYIVESLEELGKGDPEKNYESTLKNLKRIEWLLEKEKRNLERMRYDKSKREWAIKKFEEREELHRRVQELMEILGALHSPDSAGHIKTAQLIRIARKMGMLVDGLEPPELAKKQIIALQKNNPAEAIATMRAREKEMAKTILEHVKRGRSVVAVVGAVHAPGIIDELAKEGITPELYGEGISPRNWLDSVYRKARGKVYSESILRKA